MNPLNPDRMTLRELLAEVCRLLALGLIRLRTGQSREVSELMGESSLHLPGDQSGHAKRPRRRTA
jgi:hypothetical protein